ncbi:MAG: flippase [Candidatus Omnitrophota bacterium]|jgi:O-antigen/teichoic acid export membrane protein
MESVSRIAKNSLAMMAAEIINKVLALILSIAIARWMGDVKFGQYAFIITLMMLFQIIADIGLDGLVTREVAKQKDRTLAYLSSALFLKFALSVIAGTLLICASCFINKPTDVFYGSCVAGITLIFTASANIFSAVLNAHERLDIKAHLLVVSKVIVIFFSCLALYFNKNLILLIGAIAISELIRAISGWAVCSKLYGKLLAKIDLSLCKKLFIKSIPFALIGMMGLIYFKIDTVMLSLMINDQVVGWYNAAYNLLSAIMFISVSYTLAIFPSLSRSAEFSEDIFAFSWERSIKYLVLIGIPISAGTMVLSERIIILFYSSGFKQSVIALQIIIWALPWIFINSINMYVLYAAGKQAQVAVVVGISMAANIILNLIVIPKASYIGASAVTVLSEIINAILFLWVINKYLSLRTGIFKMVYKPALASMAMAIVLYCFRNSNLLLLITIGALIYITLIYMLKYLDEKDISIFSKIIKRTLPKEQPDGGFIDLDNKL